MGAARAAIPWFRFAMFAAVVTTTAFPTLAATRFSELALVPPGATPTCIKLDTAGNIYVGGNITLTPAKTYNFTAGFVAKYSPDGAPLYLTVLSGSSQDQIAAIVVDAAGEVYAPGTTDSKDFPATPGAYSTTPSGVFAVKLDASGNEQYGTFLPGTNAIDIGLDSAGNVLVSGNGTGGTATPGALGGSTCVGASFVTKLEPTLSHSLFGESCLGGHIAIDAEDNVYVAGVALGGMVYPSGSGGITGRTVLPITPGALQQSAKLTSCGGNQAGIYFCNSQYVAKFDATGSKLIYCTYLTGADGAIPLAIAFDSPGNAIIAGTTSSPDYPTSAGAVEEFYPAQGFVSSPFSQRCFNESKLPIATGYVSEINADGSALIFSTYLGGSKGDSVSAIFLSGTSVYVAGTVSSPDFPGLNGIPKGCVPA
jgi:hypothetical protein